MSTVPHTAIYRRWRAQTFSQLVGQGAVVETLRNAVRLDRVGHAYLFVGPRGTGKTSMARIVAKAVNCTNLRDGEPCDACPSCVAIREGNALDVAEFDAASNNTVSDMRELLPRVHTAPADLRRKVFIVDEVQRIKEGWDVLLKTLEEPPPHVLFIFCTTDPTQIRPAVLSRVQRFTFRPLTIDQISGKLVRILEEDGRSAEPEAIALVAELAAGGMRDAESMLDQLLSSASDPLSADDVRGQLGLAAGAEIDALVSALLDGDALAGIRSLDRLEAEGRDLRLVTDQAVERLRRLLVTRLSGAPVPDAFAAHPVGALAGAARGLASIDPSRAGGGGQRLQLELLLLGVTAPAMTAVAAPAPSATIPGNAAQVAPHVPVTNDAGAGARAEPSTGQVPRSDAAPAPRSDAPRAPGSDAVPTPRPDAAPARTPPRAARPRAGEAPALASSVPPSAPGNGPGPEDAAAFQRLCEEWPRVVAALSQSPAVRPIVEACRPVRLEGHVLVLGFPENKAFLREKAEQRHVAFEDAVSQVAGTGLAVRCIATNLEALPPLPHEAIGRDNLEAARRIFAGDVAETGDVE